MTRQLFVEYASDIEQFRFSFSIGAAYVCMTLILLGVGLDYALYPQKQQEFAAARVIAASFILGVVVLMKTTSGKRYFKWLTFLWMLQPQIMIAWMIATTEGANSIYYAGLNLAIYGSGIVLAFSLRQNIVYGLTSYALYVLACSTHPESFVLHGPFVVNSLFLLMAVTVCAIFTMFNERARFMLFQLKAEVAEKNRELEQTNRDLAEIKGHMLQQEKMAAIGTLAAGLLHEVNNPVNFCLMAIEIAMEDPVAAGSAGLTECLVDARLGMKRVQYIVSDLKTFAYRGNGVNAESDFMMEKAIDSSVRLVSHETKGITITRALPDDTLVHGDEAAIIGVLINLLSNAALALRSVARNTLTIHIGAVWHGERLQVSVSDNGPGIAAENLARVFEPFFTTREIGKGLGLGLSICYGIIQRHGGILSADSELGAWTTMIFDLPRAN